MKKYLVDTKQSDGSTRKSLGDGFWIGAELCEIMLDAYDTTGDNAYRSAFEGSYQDLLDHIGNRYTVGLRKEIAGINKGKNHVARGVVSGKRLVPINAVDRNSESKGVTLGKVVYALVVGTVTNAIAKTLNGGGKTEIALGMTALFDTGGGKLRGDLGLNYLVGNVAAKGRALRAERGAVNTGVTTVLGAVAAEK